MLEASYWCKGDVTLAARRLLASYFPALIKITVAATLANLFSSGSASLPVSGLSLLVEQATLGSRFSHNCKEVDR